MKSIKLKIKTTEFQILKIYTKFLINFLKKLNIKYKNINLPKKIKRITLLKSPHVYKKAREQFECKTFTSTIIINNDKLKLGFLKFLIINKPKALKLKLFY
jgi:small subunit ribosomal protein S10